MADNGIIVAERPRGKEKAGQATQYPGPLRPGPANALKTQNAPRGGVCV